MDLTRLKGAGPAVPSSPQVLQRTDLRCESVFNFQRAVGEPSGLPDRGPETPLRTSALAESFKLFTESAADGVTVPADFVFLTWWD